MRKSWTDAFFAAMPLGWVAIVIFVIEGDIAPALAEAEGAWSEGDVEEWERARGEAWATWPSDRSSTRTS